MAGKTKRKKGSTQKRFPYIEVEGVESRYLDAALLKVCGDGVLEHSLSDEFKLIKKAGITTQELKRKERSREELIELVSPHLLESYDFYNSLANMWEEILQKTINHYFENDYTSFTIEDWDNQIRNLIDEEAMPIYAAINTLRFYKNGEIKELIKPLLEEEEYVVKFYRETGIKVEGQELDSDWDESIDDELEENSLLEEELFDRSPDEALKMAAKIILNVSERVSDLEESEKYKKLYEFEKEQVVSFKAKVADLTQDLKSRDSQVQTLSKENRTLTKSVDSLNGKFEQQQKESGRLGGALGEIRKEKEDLEKVKANLERRVSTLEKEAGSITEKVQKELKKEFDKKALKKQDDYDEKIFQLEKQIEDLQRLLEEEQAKNSELSDVLEKTSKELSTTKNDLGVVEKERNELIGQVNQASAKEENKEEQDADDDVMFGFNEEDIEDFVEFDNKPIRN
ncbi:hypothetical protein [Bacillus cereus]|uniref:hypothetical protein n=1 Tax=Bacillus cereus TaxID=1396 RepID=UPI000BFD36A1|nr:hypothetical protein [Bacillus cereus]PGY11987.1 hypothetical protein COE23_18490 [Bacillus cereus]